MVNEADLQQEVEANLPWNFAVNIVDSMFYNFGLNLVSRETIIPLLVSVLTPSKVVIGMISATYSLGYFLPQLLTANYTEGLKRNKPFVVLWGFVLERVPYLLMGLVVWRLAASAPIASLVLMLLLLATTAASNGVLTPAWYSMIAKVIPVQRRGVFSGVGNSLAALMGIAGGVLSGRILETRAFPTDFGLLFILAFLATVISWAGLALTREPESADVKSRTSLGHYFKKLPDVLRRDRNYRRFLIGRSVANLGTMAGGFFAVYAVERFAIGGAAIGTLTAILVGSQAVMNVLWGLVADRIGHKAVLCGAALSIGLAAVVTWLAPAPSWLWVAFVLFGVSMAAESVSSMNIILEFCAPEERPTYIGLTNTLLAPSKTLAPIMGGWLATWAGYPGLFVAALIIAGLGAGLLALWVREPRHVQGEQAVEAA